VQRSRPLRLVALLAICAAVWVSAACEKVALTAPTGSTITIALSSTSVPINGSVDVIATVLESSGTAAHNGTKVSFIGSFGRFEPADATTQGGVATVKFIGTSSGTTKITAISGSAKAESGDLKVGGAAAGSVAMRSEPASLPQGGGTAQIVAVVRDSSGNLLPGAPVNFTTDQGNLGSTAGLTDANGESRVSLTTNRDAIVTATVISGVTATTNVRIITAPNVAIAVSGTPALGVPTTFTVTPTVAAGGTSIQRVTVRFGDGSPERNLGPISGATSVTHTYQSAGTFTATATATDATGQQSNSNVSVIVARIVPTVSISPTNQSVTAGGAVAFTVTATAGSGGPPIQNVTVTQNPGGSVVYSASSGGAFVRTFPTVGTHTLTASATDAAGTIGTGVAVVTVTGVAASSPTVTLTHDTAPAVAGQVEVFTVGASGGTGGITNIRVTLQDGTVLYNGNAGSFTWTPGSAGTATITAVATDGAGNTGNKILVLTVS
jgi:large repetitive protein